MIEMITTYWEAFVLLAVLFVVAGLNLVFVNLDKKEYPCMHRLIMRIDAVIIITCLVLITWKGWWC